MSEWKKCPPGTTDLIIAALVIDKPDPADTHAGADAVQMPCRDCGRSVWAKLTGLRGTPDSTHVICQPCSKEYGYDFIVIS